MSATISSKKLDPVTRRSAYILAGCQALAVSCFSLLITISPLAGNQLAPDPSLATFPVAVQFLAMMLSTWPASMLMRRYGRRTGFSVGLLIGALGGIFGCLGLMLASFALFCLGTACVGIFAAHAAFYRFAAADTADSGADKARAISWVMAGGVIAAFLGPEIAKHSRDLLAPVDFAGGLLAVTALCLLALILVQGLRIPKPAPVAKGGGGRPLAEIARQPVFLVAALCAMVGYGAMNLVMTSTPLAMLGCAHPFEASALVIQFHVLAMFAPSFITGGLIARFGHAAILGSGALLVLASVAINLSGVELGHFWGGLVLLGLGWNFLYVGGSALATRCHTPEERAKTQALYDLMVSSTVALTAFFSGAIYNLLGWSSVNLAVVVPVLLCVAASLWLARRDSQPATA